MSISEQLPLQIRLRDDAILESYFPGPNQHAYWAVKQMAKGSGDAFIYLWGNSGTGRTHLLQAACLEANKSGNSAVYVPLNELKNLNPGLFQGLERVSLICVDDLHCAVGNQAWEEALFHLFNRIRNEGGRLLTAAHEPAHQLTLKLADLKSRLSWSMNYQLLELQEEDTLVALQMRARCRGLRLTDAVGRFLIRRCSKDMHHLFQTLEHLDEASLTEKHRLTIPFVKQVLLL